MCLGRAGVVQAACYTNMDALVTPPLSGAQHDWKFCGDQGRQGSVLGITGVPPCLHTRQHTSAECVAAGIQRLNITGR